MQIMISNYTKCKLSFNDIKIPNPDNKPRERKPTKIMYLAPTIKNIIMILRNVIMYRVQII